MPFLSGKNQGILKSDVHGNHVEDHQFAQQDLVHKTGFIEGVWMAID